MKIERQSINKTVIYVFNGDTAERDRWGGGTATRVLVFSMAAIITGLLLAPFRTLIIHKHIWTFN